MIFLSVESAVLLAYDRHSPSDPDLDQFNADQGFQLRLLQERVEIRAPAEQVWDLLAAFGRVADWAPYMRHSELIGDQSSGVGMRRAMRHAWGFRFEEVITQWHEGKGFAFDVLRAPFPMKDVKETWVLAAEDGHTAVETQVRYGMRLSVLGRFVDWLLVRFIVRREMRSGLRGLKEYAERTAAREGLIIHPARTR